MKDLTPIEQLFEIPSSPEAIIYLKEVIGLLQDNVVIGDYSEGYEILFLDSQVEKQIGKGFLWLLGVGFEVKADEGRVSFKFEGETGYLLVSEAKPKLRNLVEGIVSLLSKALDPLSPHAFLKVAFAGYKSSKVRRSVTTYIVKQADANKVKIGRSSKVKQRLNDISNNCGSILQVLLLIPEDVEQELHFKFSHLRHLGEWFIDNGEIEAWIKVFNQEETDY